MHFPRAQGGAWGEVPALLRWRTEQGQETQQRIGSLVFQENLLSPEEQPSVKGGGKPCIFFSGDKQGFFLRTLDTAQSCPTFPAGRRGREDEHSLALGASVSGRTSPYPLLGAGLGPPAMCARKYPGGRRGPGVLWKGPQTFRKSLGQKVLCSGKHFAFLIFLCDRKAMQLGFLWHWNSGRRRRMGVASGRGLRSLGRMRGKNMEYA